MKYVLEVRIMRDDELTSYWPLVPGDYNSDEITLNRRFVEYNSSLNDCSVVTIKGNLWEFHTLQEAMRISRQIMKQDYFFHDDACIIIIPSDTLETP